MNKVKFTIVVVFASQMMGQYCKISFLPILDGVSIAPNALCTVRQEFLILM